jgi:predicted ABC-type ATPase
VKQLWLLAGGNGAGKSTFYHTQLKPKGIDWVNADEIAAKIDTQDPAQRDREAAVLAANTRDKWIREGRTFCYETVFSHVSKLEFVEQAKQAGYEIVLVYIHLNSHSLNQARVKQRVTEGGHDVDPEKIKQRIPRAMKYISKAQDIVDDCLLFDNSSHDDPYRPIARKRNGQVDAYEDPLPKWAQDILFGDPAKHG